MTSNLGATALRDEKSVGFGATDLSNDCGNVFQDQRIAEEAFQASILKQN